MSGATMKLTIAICTWNRAALLGMTLAAMRELSIPKGVEWEILVVNNNCTDDTENTIARYSAQLPLRSIREPSPGLSNARNAAVKAAPGDYLLWTDDDVLVDKRWLEAYTAAFRLRPDVAIFGGPITPWFEETPPEWLLSLWPRVSNAYAIRDLGPDPIPLTEEALPFGANYAVKIPAHRHYLYDPALGRNGSGMVGYEETNLIRAMLHDGFRGEWVPDARVSHFIPRERQDVGYLKRYFRGQGVYMAGQYETSRFLTLFGCPRWLVRKACQDRLKYEFRRIFCKPHVWIEDLITSSLSWGMLQGIRQRGQANVNILASASCPKDLP